MSFHIYTSSGSGRYDCSYADSLSTNLFSVEADRNDRFADRTFNFNDALYCLRVRVKQPFIFTTWTSHMHFLHIFSPPARGQPKGNVKLTVGDCFIFLCTVCRDLNPMVAINIVYRTYVLLSINFASTRKFWRSFYSVETSSENYTNKCVQILILIFRLNQPNRSFASMLYNSLNPSQRSTPQSLQYNLHYIHIRLWIHLHPNTAFISVFRILMYPAALIALFWLLDNVYRIFPEGMGGLISLSITAHLNGDLIFSFST